LAESAYQLQFQQKIFQEKIMTQKVIEIVGTSKDSFAKAAQAAVAEAAKTVRGIKWAHVDSLDMEIDGAKVVRYRATAKIYFDLEK
jgi:dodecin